MRYVSGNRAIRDHAGDGKDLHLFKQVRKGYVQYVGQMVCTGSSYKEAPDTQGRIRKAIVFELTPIEEFVQLQEEEDSETETLLDDSLETLRQKALAESAEASTRRRSKAIRVYVLKRASGVCEGCGSPAPFKKASGQPYLEPHHTRRLADGGPDHPRWVVAVCPNCHRRAHHAADAAKYNQE